MRKNDVTLTMNFFKNILYAGFNLVNPILQTLFNIMEAPFKKTVEL